MNVELVGGPRDGEFIEFAGGAPGMPMILWVEGTKSTYGWDGDHPFDGKLNYMGERDH